jgi:hypothetical protein
MSRAATRYTKRQLEQMVRASCNRCAQSWQAVRDCQDALCPLWGFMHEPDQLLLFGPEPFVKAVEEWCDRHPVSFAWGDMRKAILAENPGLYIKPQWWGGIAQKAVKWCGFVRTEDRKRGATKRGHGNYEHVYERRTV